MLYGCFSFAINVATLLHNDTHGRITENEKKQTHMELEPWSQGTNLEALPLKYRVV